MKLYLTGHDYKYAVEQSLLAMFPDERPIYPEGGPEGDRAEIKLFWADKYATARCELYMNGLRFDGSARAKTSAMTGKLERDRRLQRIIKLAFYRAALRSGAEKPVWGALTGIRPAKLATGLILSGMSCKRAETRLRREYGVSRERASLCVDASLAGIKVRKGLNERDICLYVGIPFCPTRCAYCSFVGSETAKNQKLVEPFLEALFLEIESTSRTVTKLGLRPISVYIGGGTPTALSPDQLKNLCSRLLSFFDFSSVTEYSAEAGRPDTITPEKLDILKSFGVNRVCVNPQSMDDAVLAAIGRGHSASDVLDAMRAVRNTAGMSVNMDLIAGLPSDSPAGFSQTLGKIIGLSPENITVHTLSLKRGSNIRLSDYKPPPGAAVGAMLDEAMLRLRQSGYSPYYLYRQKFMSGGFENVGWCRDGFLSVYNVCIMEELCSIISMGGGASTKLVSAQGRIERLFAPKYPAEYIAGLEKTIANKKKIEVFYHAV